MRSLTNSRLTAVLDRWREFTPHPLLRNRHLQTLIAARPPRVTGPMAAAARPMILEVEAEEQVRLHGLYSPQTDRSSRGLVLLHHGWLGCSESPYMRRSGEFLFQQGYAVFRLDMRDHGASLPLNEGLFHGNRLLEAYEAARRVGALEPEGSLYLVGFSMGGNFALRMAALNGRVKPIPNLAGVIAISPSVDPAKATQAIDRYPFYRAYFLHRWRQAMREKERLFPQRYHFAALLRLKTAMAMSDYFVARYTPYASLDAYFTSYSVDPTRLVDLKMPVVILSAADDPIIPVAGVQHLAGCNPYLSVLITPCGGHVGFVDGFPLRYPLNDIIDDILDRLAG